MKRLLLSLFVLLSLANVALSQERIITGTVKGKDDGSPIPGVSVKVKGTSIGAATKSDGT